VIAPRPPPVRPTLRVACTGMGTPNGKEPQGSVRRVRSAERQDVEAVVDGDVRQQAVDLLRQRVAAEAEPTAPPA
jgi:hypothetical protein